LAQKNGHWFEFEKMGERFQFWVDDSPDTIQSWISQNADFYEADALELMRASIPEGARIVDVGANIGNHAIFFDRIAKAEKVFVIEPNNDVLTELQVNAKANQCKALDFSTSGFAVGEFTGKGRLEISSSDVAIRNRGGAQIVQSDADGTIPIKRLDDLQLGEVDLLKIDVEGSAMQVLAGGASLINEAKPVIYVEINLVDVPQFTDWLQRCAYRVEAALEYHASILNYLLLPTDADRNSARASQDGGKKRSLLPQLAEEKNKAARSEETLALVLAEKEALEDELVTVGQNMARLQENLNLRAAEFSNLTNCVTHLENELKIAQRSILQRALLRKNGRPKKALRRLLLHTSGRPRGIFRKYLISEDGVPHSFFHDWMTSVEYLAQRDFCQPQKVVKTQEAPAPAIFNDDSPSFSDLPKRALIIDASFPNPTRDSGSVDAVNYVNWLLSLGFEVDFIALAPDVENYDDSAIRATKASQLRFSSKEEINKHIRQNGKNYNLFFLSRVSCGGAFFEECRIANPVAAVVFNTVDLHHIREMREAQIANSLSGAYAAQNTRDRELYLIRQADLTIVVSEFEKDLLDKFVPGARVSVMPLYRELPSRVSGFESRNGIGFVGGFKHVPNIDAIKYFLKEMWPLVRDKAPNATFSIAGSDLPEDIANTLPEGVSYIGHVEDLTEWLNGLKMTVAPLRYGAGAKGKVASSISHGVPVVGTKISFEGMGLVDDAVIATEDPADFASAIVHLLEDQARWETMSQKAKSFGQANLSVESGQIRLEQVFKNVRLRSSQALL